MSTKLLQNILVQWFLAMKCNFELVVPKNTWLVNQMKSAANMYYLGGNNCGTDCVQQIQMNIVSETNPEKRYYKLLYKGRLDEAEVIFAIYVICPIWMFY